MLIESVESCSSALPLSSTSYLTRSPVRIFTTILLSGEATLKLDCATVSPASQNNGARINIVFFNRWFMRLSLSGIRTGIKSWGSRSPWFIHFMILAKTPSLLEGGFLSRAEANFCFQPHRPVCHGRLTRRKKVRQTLTVG